MLQVRPIQSLEEFRRLRPDWNDLLSAEDPYGVFLSHQWVSAWFDAYGGRSDPMVLVCMDGNHLYGVLPLRASSRRIVGVPFRRLDFMANGHSPRADLVARPEHEDAVCQTLARYLLEKHVDWHLAMFPEVQDGSLLLRLFEHFPQGRRHAQPQRSSPYIPLDGTWDEYRKTISKRFLKVLRNNRNRVTRQGPTEIELFEDPADLESVLEDVFRIGERSWQGKEGSAVGSTPENRRFYTCLTQELGQLGMVRLWLLKLDGKRVAFELHIVNAGVEFGLKTGYDLEFDDIGIGTYLDQHIVERLFAEDRCHEYDLLGDSDFYKMRWTDKSRDYQRLLLFGQSTNSRILGLWNLKLRPVLKERIKPLRKTAALWAALGPALAGPQGPM